MSELFLCPRSGSAAMPFKRPAWKAPDVLLAGGQSSTGAATGPDPQPGPSGLQQAGPAADQLDPPPPKRSRIETTEGQFLLLSSTSLALTIALIGCAVAAKYSTANSTAVKILGATPHCALMSAAFSKSSWNKHEAALSSFALFSHTHRQYRDWPISYAAASSYISWAVNVKQLKGSTISSYISSLKTVHILKALDCSGLEDKRLQYLLKGAANLDIYSEKIFSSRRAMSFPILNLLGNALAASTILLPEDRQMLWSAFTLAFFGSLRFGEILACSATTWVKGDTFLWEDVNFFGSDQIVLKLKNTKTSAVEFVDIFAFTGKSACPVKALSIHRSNANAALSDPVFRWKSNKNLLIQEVNAQLSTLLHPYLGSASSGISAHSFRAALPSLLDKHPNAASVEDLKGWGRWTSTAYTAYTRLKPERKRAVFNNMLSLL